MSGSAFSSSDGGAARTRCSPNKIAEVVATFGPMKRRLVTEIGFKGMLEVPDICNLDTKFTIDLLERVDIKKRAIVLNDESFIELSGMDVQHFLDIPNGQQKLFGLEDKSTSEQIDFIQLGIGSISGDVSEKNSLKAAEEILLADYPNGMSVLQEEQFKVSFVCFCMGNLLVAKYSSNHGAKDYWGSLMEVSQISSYDFCEAVVEEIIEAAKHVQKEKKGKKTIKNVSGCHLYLQAKFLDSINLGILNIKDNSSPRIAKFTFRVIEEMKIYVKQNTGTIRTKHGASLCVQRGDAMKLGAAVTTISGKGKGAMADSSNYVRTRCISSSSHAQSVNRCGTSFMSQKRARESVNICNYVNTIQKPKSTEYLSAYTRENRDRRLNDKQLNVLRCHNARMRPLVNNFKSSTLQDMDCDQTAILTCKEVVNCNVNKLLEAVLDQVLVLTKGLHDNSSMYNSARLMVCGSNDINATSSGRLVSGYEGAPTTRKRGRIFGRMVNDITGKNLIHDLTGLDDVEMSEATDTHHGNEGQNLIQDLTVLDDAEMNEAIDTHHGNEGFVTPEAGIGQQRGNAFSMDIAGAALSRVEPANNFINVRYGNEGFVTPEPGIVHRNGNEFSTEFAGSAIGRVEPANYMINVQTGHDQSSSGVNSNMFSTPPILIPLIVDSPNDGGENTSHDAFDEILEDLSDLELHQRAVQQGGGVSTIVKIRLTKGRMARSPWSYAMDREVMTIEVAERLYNWLGVTERSCLKSWWVKHGCPTVKEITGGDFKRVFREGVNCTEDMVDMAIRRFGQKDMDMYGKGRMVRWMHPFESDFAACLLYTDDYLSNRSIEIQLTGKSHEYDVSNCRMLAVPHLDMENWTAYFWDMKRGVVHVVDPTFDISRACELHEKHGPIVDKLQAGIQKCFTHAYIGWDIDWANWSKNYVLPFLPGKNSNDSGMLTLLAMREFNGEGFSVPRTEASLKAFSMNLLYDMLSVEGNTGELPDVFVQSIG